MQSKGRELAQAQQQIQTVRYIAVIYVVLFIMEYRLTAET